MKEYMKKRRKDNELKKKELERNKTLYGALTRWGYLNTHITALHMIHTVYSYFN